MDRFINLPLLKQPLNWVLVWLILLFAGFAWHVVHDALQGNPNTAVANDANSKPFNANG